MATSGQARSVSGASDRSAATKAALVDAATDLLKTRGFAGASARAIAERAGCNQAVIFYHFGSVASLLLAALDSVSAARAARYWQSLEGAESATELVDVAAANFQNDLDAGYVKVLVEMLSGASAAPGLGPEVAARIRPWKELTCRALEGVFGATAVAQILPIEEMAYAVVALFLGLELLSDLDGDRSPALALFERARSLSGILAALDVTEGPPESAAP